jgi:hypothetical protein
MAGEKEQKILRWTWKDSASGHMYIGKDKERKRVRLNDIRESDTKDQRAKNM